MPLKSYTQAELFLTERRRLELPLLAMIWLGVISASVSPPTLDVFYILIGTFAVAVNLFAVLRTKELYVARPLVNIAVLVATAIMLVEAVFYSATIVDALRHYIILIQLCKLFERKTNRDYAQMIILSILLMVAGAVNSRQMLFAATMIVETVLICYVMMILTIKRGLDRVAATQLTTTSSTKAVRHVAWNVIRDWPGRAIRRRLWSTIPLMLLAGALAFLAAPRSSSSDFLMSANMGGSTGITGMTDSVRLGEQKKIYQSSEIVMRVSFRYANATDGAAASRPTGESASQPQPPFYLRGIAYNAYSRRGWTRGHPASRGHPAARNQEVLSLPDPEILQDAIVQEVQMSPTLLPIMFACDAVVGMEPDTLCSIDRNLNLEMIPTEGRGTLSHYTAYSLPAEAQRKHADFLDDLHTKMGEASYTDDRGPSVTPNVLELANVWCADLPRPSPGSSLPNGWEMAIANRISARLQERCTYTLDLSQVDMVVDPIEDFLFNTRTGNCEYFASALVVMCRSQGVKARLATGFRVDADAREGAVYVVQGRDAHAWAEVRTGDFWTIVDPTPGGTPLASEHSWWSAVKQWYDDMRSSWDQNVIGYNAQSRERFWQWCAASVSAMWSWIKSAWASLGMSFINFLVMGQVDTVMFTLIGLISAAAFLAEALLFSRLIRRIRANRLAAADPVLSAHGKVQFILKFFAMLERKGLPSPPGRTMRESARMAADHFRLPYDAMAKLVELYYRLRWGRRPPEPQEIVSAARVAEQLKSMLPK